MEPIEVKRAAELIAANDSVMIFGHQWPDGDAIGSVLALAITLSRAGFKVQASWPEPLEIPHKYQFLPGLDLLVESGRVKQEGFAISVDCANTDRLQELKDAALRSDGLLNIDHHPDNTRFGTINLVDSEASATAEIITRNAGTLGLAIGREAALCLYAGLVTDTGRFQFTNTTANTLKAAAELVAMGVEPHTIYENVYQSDSLAYIRLTGEILTSAVFDEGLGLIYGCVMQKDLLSFGVKMNETEELIDDLRALKGHRIAALFKEQAEGTIRVSLRSRIDCDIGAVARKLGGGGHRVAAGYTSSRKDIDGAVEELKDEIVASGGSTGCR